MVMQIKLKLARDPGMLNVNVFGVIYQVMMENRFMVSRSLDGAAEGLKTLSMSSMKPGNHEYSSRIDGNQFQG